MMNSGSHVSIVIVTYNSERYVDRCLRSVCEQRYPTGCSTEVIVVDNCSRDGTVPYIAEHFPHVTVIQNDANVGWSAANNQGAARATGTFVIFLNPDTICEEGWLAPLITPLVERPMLLTTPKILVYDGSRIGNCGNILHFTGLAFTRGLGAPPTACARAGPVSYVSGCCFGVRRAEFMRLGGFDEALFLYHDDLDFSCKAYLAGFESCYVPGSIIRHDYTLTVPPEKLALLEEGRYIFLRKHFSSRDLASMAPSLFAAEALSWSVALKLGVRGVAAKLRALRVGLSGPIVKRHGDRANLLRHLSATVPDDQLTSNRVERAGVRVANRVFRLNAPC